MAVSYLPHTHRHTRRCRVKSEKKYVIQTEMLLSSSAAADTNLGTECSLQLRYALKAVCSCLYSSGRVQLTTLVLRRRPDFQWDTILACWSSCLITLVGNLNIHIGIHIQKSHPTGIRHLTHFRCRVNLVMPCQGQASFCMSVGPAAHL